MKLKRPSFASLAVILVAVGSTAVLGGCFMLFGLPVALIVGGAGAVALGLTVEV